MKLIDFVSKLPYGLQIRVRGACGYSENRVSEYYNGTTQNFPLVACCTDYNYTYRHVCGSSFWGKQGYKNGVAEATSLEIVVGDAEEDATPYLPCKIGSTVYIPYVYLEVDGSGVSGIEEATLVGFVDETLVGGKFWWLAAVKVKDGIETHDIPRAELCITQKQAEDRLAVMVKAFMKENKVHIVERNLGI